MATTTDIPLDGLARKLVQDNLLSHDTAQDALQGAKSEKLPFVTYLTKNDILSARQVATMASLEFGLPLFDISRLEASTEIRNLVNEKLVRKHHLLPIFKRGNKLFVAISDPTNLQALDEIKFASGHNIEAIVVEDSKLVQAIEKSFSQEDLDIGEGLDDEDLDALDIVSGEEEMAQTEDDSGEDDAPIVRFVNKVLLDGIHKGVSDLHFEPYEKSFRIRFRQDGILHTAASPPMSIANRLTARIKVMARMDISERRIPQDGRIKLSLSKKRAIDFRVNTLPTLWGEKIVMRILDPSSAKIGIDALGYEPGQKENFMEAIHKPQGMVLVTGPTGSGKTVSLYTGLNILNTDERNISTAEDPVEINLAGINQVNMNPKVGLTFSSALRAFLRQDPDVIMVGEIRDKETGEIAIKAAQTGHMVLSTLHTNSAPETLNRLMNMGIEPFNIATSVNLIIAQRLARRLCPHCKKETKLPKEVLTRAGFTAAEIPDLNLFEAVGCSKCKQGYSGRVGIYEVMPISEEMQNLIMTGANSLQLAQQAKEEGINDLRRSGLNKVAEGLTSLEEINRVTKD